MIANDDVPPPASSLQLTDVTVTPDSKYAFDVMAGMRRVLSFHFDALQDAAEAADSMSRLLPRIEAARWKRRTV